ncbi:MAG: efflux RND transporter periplasmic adaptor subunit [Desulfobulbaceae bacterium]|nr:efflux RND transporter periplasmic adaptor subunit [Desulfobulbaceae bacterium]
MNENTPVEPHGTHHLFNSRKGVLWALAVVLFVVIGGAYSNGFFRSSHEHHDEAEKTKETYVCPMHPQIVSDRPGTCPICSMDLVKAETSAPAPFVKQPAGKAKNDLDDLFDEPSSERKILYYRNPMDPSITSPTPAKDEMGMEYVPVYNDEVGSKASNSAGVEGMATIRVGEEALMLTGVQTSPARKETAKRTVRTVGIVVADETLVRHVHTKVRGWIETLSTNFTGQAVQKDTPLLSIYSPELLATQQEFLSAKRAAASMVDAADPAIKRMGNDLLQSAKRRLELFDVPKSFIEKLEKSGEPQRAVTLEAPISGFVTAKGVYEGQEIEPGMELFTITDLSHVWIEADLYEYEANLVEVGQEATLTLAFSPGTVIKGKVAYVFPYLSAESRTLKVRFDFPNPTLTLKPQMYVDVSLALAQAPGVTIPDSALIDTGVRQVVFVETAPGTFEPRQVKVGVRGGGKIQIMSGIKEGEQVVVKANFLLDSESRLRAALEKAIGGGNK